MTVVIASQHSHRPGAVTHIGDDRDLISRSIYHVQRVGGGACQIDLLPCWAGRCRLQHYLIAQLQPLRLLHLAHVVHGYGTFFAGNGVGLFPAVYKVDAGHSGPSLQGGNNLVGVCAYDADSSITIIWNQHKPAVRRGICAPWLRTHRDVGYYAVCAGVYYRHRSGVTISGVTVPAVISESYVGYALYLRKVSVGVKCSHLKVSTYCNPLNEAVGLCIHHSHLVGAEVGNICL